MPKKKNKLKVFNKPSYINNKTHEELVHEIKSSAYYANLHEHLEVANPDKNEFAPPVNPVILVADAGKNFILSPAPQPEKRSWFDKYFFKWGTLLISLAALLKPGAPSATQTPPVVFPIIINQDKENYKIPQKILNTKVGPPMPDGDKSFSVLFREFENEFTLADAVKQKYLLSSFKALQESYATNSAKQKVISDYLNKIVIAPRMKSPLTVSVPANNPSENNS